MTCLWWSLLCGRLDDSFILLREYASDVGRRYRRGPLVYGRATVNEHRSLGARVSQSPRWRHEGHGWKGLRQFAGEASWSSVQRSAPRGALKSQRESAARKED